MPQNNFIMWVEIPVTDMARAEKFYSAVFGIDAYERIEMGPMKMSMLPFDMAASGGSGALVQGPGYVPSQVGSLVYFTIDDIEDKLAKVAANGGRKLMPKTPIGQYGWIARFEDSEGNLIALHTMPQQK